MDASSLLSKIIGNLYEISDFCYDTVECKYLFLSCLGGFKIAINRLMIKDGNLHDKFWSLFLIENCSLNCSDKEKLIISGNSLYTYSSQ